MPQEAAQYQTHSLVDRLVEQLGGDKTQAHTCLSVLVEHNASATPKKRNVVTAKASIGRHCHGNAHIFRDLYNRIEASRCSELEPMVLFLSKVLENPELKSFIETAESRRARPPPAPVAPLPPAAALYTTPAEAKRLLAELAAVGDEQRGGYASSRRSGAVAPPPNTDRSPAKAPVLPGAPSWLTDRPFLTADFANKAERGPTPALPIGSLPFEVQEAAIIDDVLNVMLGIEGRYIRAVPRADGDLRTIGNAADFLLDHTVDPSLRDLTKKILPLAVYYSNVAQFTDGKDLFRDGLVRQAVAAGMRALVKEYMIVVAQLETQYSAGDLSLQKLWFYVQPCLATLEALSSIAVDVVNRDLKGGALLSLLNDRAVGQLGDATAAELAHHLAQLASVPYFDMLEQWIYKGVVDDPFSEFMVREDVTISRDSTVKTYNDAYWERRYTVSKEQEPSFLAGMTDKILHTGKYLNVIRESGRSPQYPNAVAITYQTRGRAYAGVIDNTFAYASASLLKLLNSDLKLMEQLESIKNYFCMFKGDFFSHFIDTAHEDLSKLVSDIEPSRVTALLEMALRVSSASSDPFKDSLTFSLVPHTLVTELFRIMNVTVDFQGHDRGFVNPESFTLDATDTMEESDLKGLGAFTFDYDVQWPVSLIISRRSLKRYQILFRFLFQCRLVERVLTNTWLDDQYFKDSIQLEDASRGGAFALRQRMLNFVQSLQYYSMFEVIEPMWHIMVKELAGASTIDDVLAIHNSFLDKCLKGCMLTNPSTLKTISKLLSVCDIFGSYNKNISSKKMGADGRAAVAAAKKFESSITSFNARFNELMHKLLSTMTEFAATASEQQMSNMVARLDFNGFYQEEWTKAAQKTRHQEQSASRSAAATDAARATTDPQQA